MANKTVFLEYVDEHIAVLRMEDSANKNALTTSFIKGLQENLDCIKKDPKVKVLIFKGYSDVFCSGADKSTLMHLLEGKIKPSDIFLPKIILDLPIPVIAAMEGHAVGGGFALGLCADIILIAKNSRYGCNFMNMGFTPGMGTTKLLENVLSPAIAHELLYTGELKKGKEFTNKGTFNEILPKEEVFPKAMAIAERIAEKPKTSLELLKKILSLPKRKCFEETITYETLMHQISFSNSDLLKTIDIEYIQTGLPYEK